MNVHASVHASVTHIMINHKYWPILSYNNSHITGIILEHVDQFYKWMSGRLSFIVGDISDLKSRHTFLCTGNTQAIRCFESFPFRLIFFIFVRQITWFWWIARHWTLAFDPQLKKILTFSVKDRYQLNYLICIKDFNV